MSAITKQTDVWWLFLSVFGSCDGNKSEYNLLLVRKLNLINFFIKDIQFWLTEKYCAVQLKCCTASACY